MPPHQHQDSQIEVYWAEAPSLRLGTEEKRKLHTSEQ